MAETSQPKKMPRGVRKGGTRYPRHSLEECVVWAKKLVSKTHLGPQPSDVILTGVVGAKSSTGEIKLSSLKQYGLLEGTASAYTASLLAKNIASAPSDELIGLYRKSALAPIIFKSLFDTFHGDEITRQKLKQRAADLNVHPDETDNCIEIYISTLRTAGLVKADGDKVIHLSSLDAQVAQPNATSDEIIHTHEINTNNSEEKIPEADENHQISNGDRQPIPRAVFNVNVTLDSSLDTEKLAKQLELLKRFGAI